MTVRNTCAEATRHVPWDFNGQVMQFRLGQTVSNRKYLEPHHRKTISSRTIYTVFSMAIAHHWSNSRWRLGFTKNEHRFVKGALKRYNILYSTYLWHADLELRFATSLMMQGDDKTGVYGLRLLYFVQYL